MLKIVTGLVVLVLTSACASTAPPGEADTFLAHTLERAETHHAAGRDAEALMLIEAVERVDDHYIGLEPLREAIAPEVLSLFHHPYLGSNYALRAPTDRRWWSQTLWYLPDRVLDLFDIFSIDLHLGFGVYANGHMTRALQLGGGARTTAGLGFHDHRSLGTQIQAEAGLAVLGAGAQGYAGMLAGTSGIVTGSEGLAGFHRPSSKLYQDYRDYWATGVSLTAAVIGVEFDLHPMQAVDFALGLVTIDWLKDDFAKTRGLELEAADHHLLRTLYAFERAKVGGKDKTAPDNELASR